MNKKEMRKSHFFFYTFYLYKGYLPWSYFERTNKLEYKKKVLEETSFASKMISKDDEITKDIDKRKKDKYTIRYFHKSDM